MKTEILITPSDYHSIYLTFYLSVSLSIYLSVCLSLYLTIYLPVCLSIYLPIYIYLSISIYLRIYYISIYISIHISIYLLSIALSVYLSVYLSIYLSIYLTMKQSPSWEANRSSASQEIPHFMEPEVSLQHSPTPLRLINTSHASESQCLVIPELPSTRYSVVKAQNTDLFKSWMERIILHEKSSLGLHGDCTGTPDNEVCSAAVRFHDQFEVRG